MLLASLDNWLVDHVFQPLTARLTRYAATIPTGCPAHHALATPISLAEFMLGGTQMFAGLDLYRIYATQAGLLPACPTTMLIGFSVVLLRECREVRAGRRTPASQRLAWPLTRLATLFSTVVSVLGAAKTEPAWLSVAAFGMLLTLGVGLYAMCCRETTPDDNSFFDDFDLDGFA